MKNTLVVKKFKARHRAIGIRIKSSTKNPFQVLKQIMLENSLYETGAE